MRDFESPTRSVAYSTRAMAATSHPRATLTAIETLRSGGNAVDAAVAAAAVLGVVEPQMTGVGGDCFVLYAPAGGEVIAYNGSGRAPAAAETAWYRERGILAIDPESAHAVTIPGAVEAWHRLVSDYGRKGLDELFEPAIDLAENGHPVHPRVAYDWAQFAPKLSRRETAARVYLADGRAPRPGEMHRLPELAATMRRIAELGPEGFYTGPVAEDMVATLNASGGIQTLEDFAAAKGTYEVPVSTNYRGYDILECPPNGQGFVALMMLNIFQGFSVANIGPLDTTRLHLEAEAGRLAFRDRNAYLADPAVAPVPVATLLSQGYADQLRAEINLDRAMGLLPEPALPAGSDTVYLCVVDEDRNAVSFINSIFGVFGTGLVSENTGVLFQNRGSGFVIDESHPNTIAPGKRPLHTIIPGMVVRNGRAVMPFGVMGGQYQPFGHFHLLTNIIDFGLDLQAAIDSPRVFHFDGILAAENRIPAASIRGLEALGHTVVAAGGPMGGGQAIWIDRDRGVLSGGSDPRKDGCALGY